MASLLALAALWVMATPALGEEYRLTLDPEETTVRFTLGATGHDVEGGLALRHGELRIDPAAGTASGTLEIDAGSSETGNAKRDKTMHSKVLEVEDHPMITFTSEAFEGSLPASGEGTAEIRGKLVLVGGEHPFTLPVKFEVESGQFEAETQFPVPFIEWGLHDPSILFLRVEKVVQVKVEATGTLSPVTVVTASTDGE